MKVNCNSPPDAPATIAGDAGTQLIKHYPNLFSTSTLSCGDGSSGIFHRVLFGVGYSQILS